MTGSWGWEDILFYKNSFHSHPQATDEILMQLVTAATSRWNAPRPIGWPYYLQLSQNWWREEKRPHRWNWFIQSNSLRQAIEAHNEEGARTEPHFEVIIESEAHWSRGNQFIPHPDNRNWRDDSHNEINRQVLATKQKNLREDFVTAASQGKWENQH